MLLCVNVAINRMPTLRSPRTRFALTACRLTDPIQIDYFTTMIRLIVNGTVLCQEARTSRPAYSTVYVYAANPWYDAASGSISGLYFQVRDRAMVTYEVEG